MPYAPADDGTKLHYEEAGHGTPVIFVHELAGDSRSWTLQMQALAPHHRCIAFDARGYPPSDVPPAGAYSQAHAADDVAAVLRHLGIARAHVVGLSMGGFATLHFGLRHGDKALSLTIAGCGHGADPRTRATFRADCASSAELIERQGMAAFAERYGVSPTRLRFRTKNPGAWAEFAARLAGHSAAGTANTLRGVQMARPSLWDLVDEIGRVTLPALILTGDEDDPCLEAGILMKRAMMRAGMVVFAQSGHTINLEEPELFNRTLADFLRAVDAGGWEPRDPKSMTGAFLGAR